MAAYLVRRVAWAWVVFLAVTLVTFVVFFVVPNGPPGAVQGHYTSQRLARELAHTAGTDRPVLVQYVGYLRGLVDGSLGRSWLSRRPVDDVVLKAAPVTASLVLGGVLIWLAIGLSVGVLSAVRQHSLLDRTTMIAVLVGISAHPIWIGFVLLYLLSTRAHLFPGGGYCDFFSPPAHATCGGPAEWAWHLALPCLTLAVFYAAMYVRMVRANVLEVLDEDYVRTARAKGASDLHVLVRHVLRNALLPVVTMLGMDVGLSLGAASFIEVVFGLPGLGRVAFEHLGFIRSLDTNTYTPPDLPVTAGIVVVMTVAIIVFNLVADLLYGWIDPRIDVRGRESAIPV
ncbi:MAG TPA: ABC transporter permease [Gaiellaceae bacterium]|nr:ABC transporter permease [Gaiellaceae bacterium]